MKSFYLLILFAPLCVFNTQAQSSVNASGAEAMGTGGSMSYSDGQIVFQTHTGPNSSAPS
jgi:hypothetical protein